MMALRMDTWGQKLSSFLWSNVFFKDFLPSKQDKLWFAVFAVQECWVCSFYCDMKCTETCGGMQFNMYTEGSN